MKQGRHIVVFWNFEAGKLLRVRTRQSEGLPQREGRLLTSTVVLDYVKETVFGTELNFEAATFPGPSATVQD